MASITLFLMRDRNVLSISFSIYLNYYYLFFNLYFFQQQQQQKNGRTWQSSKIKIKIAHTAVIKVWMPNKSVIP